MKTSVVLISIGLVVVALAVLFLGGPDRDYTTRSAEAYELYEAGNAHLMAFQFSEANKALTEAVELDPEFAAGHALLAQARFRVGQRESAMESMAIADSLLKDLSNELERTKILLTISGLKGLAVTTRDSLIDVILAEQPEDVQALSVRATLQSARDIEAAEATYAKLLTIEPNHAPAYNMLGYLAAGRGEYEDALAHLRKYAFLAPELANPHDSLGEVLAWTGQYAEAEREFEISVRIQPDFHYSRINLGEIWMEQGQVKRGLSQLEAIRADVAGTDYEQMIDEILVRFLYYHDLRDEALVAIDRYIERHPEAFQTDYYRAIALLARGEREEAATTIGAFLARVRGEGYPKTEQYSRFIDQLAMNYDAFQAQMDGDWDTAAGSWSQILVQAADQPPHQVWPYRYRLGQARYHQERYAEALESASEALAHNSNLLQPLLLAGRAAHAAGEDRIAHKALSRLGKLLVDVDGDLPIHEEFRILMQQVADQ